MDGQGRATIKANTGRCVEALTIDFVTQSVFWVDRCDFKLESIRIDGEQTSNFFQVHLGTIFSQGISIFDNYLYWTSNSGLSATVKRLDSVTGQPVVEVTSSLRGLLGGIEVVHPSKQPDGN